MTAPFSFFDSPLKPSMKDFNTLILQLNAMFANSDVAGSLTVSGNATVAGTTNLQDAVTMDDALTVTGVSTLNGGIVGGTLADIAINTDKLTVEAATGNTLIGGDLAVVGSIGASAVATSSLELSADDALTALGTDRASSLALTESINNITTAASGTGVTAPAAEEGKIVLINNLGANPIKIYGAGSDTIDGVAAATGVTLTNAKRALLMAVSPTAYITLTGAAAT